MLQEFNKWFSKLSVKKQQLIINKLEEVYELTAIPVLKEANIYLKRNQENLLQTIESLEKELKQSNDKINKLEGIINNYESNKKYNLVNFNHLWSRLSSEEKEELKKAVVSEYYYDQVKSRNESLEKQYKRLKRSYDDLLDRFLSINK